MTILNFVLDEKGVYLLTDTVASDPDDMEPINFTTKVFPAPHWQGLICGTGILQFITAWYVHAITSIVAKDIKHLDQFAPDILRSRFTEFQEQANGEFTSTIYHFGFDDLAGKFIGFAYRSTNDFDSEQLDYGIGLKPNPEVDPPDIIEFPIDLIPIAELQKVKDAKKPLDQRVGVGGQLISYVMRHVDVGDGEYQVTTAIHRCHEFSDFPAAYMRACAKLPANAPAR